MERVIVESRYAGDIEANTAYARACLHDSLLRGEAPLASHLLYTQPGVLRDDIPEQRKQGIDAGLAWRIVADYSVFYIDHGWSPGMLQALALLKAENRPYLVRSIAMVRNDARIARAGPTSSRPTRNTKFFSSGSRLLKPCAWRRLGRAAHRPYRRR